MQSNETEFRQKNDASKFTGAWTPAGIQESEHLSGDEKDLLSLIYNLDGGKGCQANNEYFSRRNGWRLRKTERIVTSLKAGGWINISAAGSAYRKIYASSKTIELIDNWKDTPSKMTGLNSDLNPVKNDGVTPLEMTVDSDKNSGVTPSKMTDIYNNDITEYNTDSTNTASDEISRMVLDVDLILTPQEAAPAIKGKKKKEKSGGELVISDAQFENCWKAFERYGSKKKALDYWRKLTQEQRNEIEAIIPDYVASTPGCQYRKMFEGWINPENELWRRPIRKNSDAPKFSKDARNANIKRDLDAISNDPNFHVSDFDRDLGMMKKLFDF